MSECAGGHGQNGYEFDFPSKGAPFTKASLYVSSMGHVQKVDLFFAQVMEKEKKQGEPNVNQTSLGADELDNGAGQGA